MSDAERIAEKLLESEKAAGFSDDAYVAALKREHSTYVAQGKTDRAKQVEEQLKAHGSSADDPEAEAETTEAPEAEEKPTKPRPRSRAKR